MQIKYKFWRYEFAANNSQCKTVTQTAVTIICVTSTFASHSNWQEVWTRLYLALPITHQLGLQFCPLEFLSSPANCLLNPSSGYTQVHIALNTIKVCPFWGVWMVAVLPFITHWIEKEKTVSLQSGDDAELFWLWALLDFGQVWVSITFKLWTYMYIVKTKVGHIRQGFEALWTYTHPQWVFTSFEE